MTLQDNIARFYFQLCQNTNSPYCQPCALATGLGLFIFPAFGQEIQHIHEMFQVRVCSKLVGDERILEDYGTTPYTTVLIFFQFRQK